VNRAASPALRAAAIAALATGRGVHATIEVTLPDGTVGLACAADVSRDTGRQDVRVSQGRRNELWFACQLAPVSMPGLVPWHETAPWLRLLAVDAEIYDSNLATMVRLARRGCAVSERNARVIYDRTFRPGGAS
jgi:hypothetical protein